MNRSDRKTIRSKLPEHHSHARHATRRRSSSGSTMVTCAMIIAFLLTGFPTALLAGGRRDVQLASAKTVSGYVARLLINETPFPGEAGWVSEDDTKAAMLAILWVLDCRLKHIPDGYTQQQIASVRCKDIIDVITAGGEKGQCDGFYRDAEGHFVSVPRVGERIDYLLTAANRGKPGRFARLFEYADQLAASYTAGGIAEADRFASLQKVSGVAVTGRAYSWMTNRGTYHPGGNFVRIPDSDSGAIGGNRFFTLRKLK